MENQDFSDEKRFEDRLKDLERRTHTLEDRHEDMMRAASTNPDYVGMPSGDGAAPDMAALEKRVAKLEKVNAAEAKADKADARADAKAASAPHAMSNPFSAPDPKK